jgi:hypothetical protein
MERDVPLAVTASRPPYKKKPSTVTAAETNVLALFEELFCDLASFSLKARDDVIYLDPRLLGARRLLPRRFALAKRKL